MLNNDAVLLAALGHVYVAPVDTTAPTPAQVAAFDPDSAPLPAPWTDLGHTSREDLPEFGFEGGETETRGTWQNAALREVITEVAVDYLIVRLHQFDDQALSLYYGVSNSSATPGVFEVQNTPTSTQERALAMVMVDGDFRIGFYAPRVSIRREDAIELAVDEFGVMPIRCTLLKSTGQPLFQWVNEDVFNPSSV